MFLIQITVYLHQNNTAVQQKNELLLKLNTNTSNKINGTEIIIYNTRYFINVP